MQQCFMELLPTFLWIHFFPFFSSVDCDPRGNSQEAKSPFAFCYVYYFISIKLFSLLQLWKAFPARFLAETRLTLSIVIKDRKIFLNCLCASSLVGDIVEIGCVRKPVPRCDKVGKCASHPSGRMLTFLEGFLFLQSAKDCLALQVH